MFAAGLKLWHVFVAVGGTGLVVWGIQHWIERRGKHRDTSRTECRSKVDETTKLIREIEALALEYFHLDGADPKCRQLEIAIKSKLTQLSIDCAHIEKSLPGVPCCKLFLAYKRALTLTDFESVRRVARNADHNIFAAISGKARVLEDRLETGFRSRYP